MNAQPGNNLPHLLDAARERGSEATRHLAIPAGLDHFTAYVGLIGSALELGKLAASEKRDLAVIGNHYELERARIDAASREIEAAMTADFARDETLKLRTFESINLLIAAGQYEIAGEFHKRLMDGFARPSLESIVALRHPGSAPSTTRLRSL